MHTSGEEFSPVVCILFTYLWKQTIRIIFAGIPKLVLLLRFGFAKRSSPQDDSCTALRAAVPHGARHAAMGHRRGVGCYAAFPTAVDGVVTLPSQPFIIATVTWQENANFGQSTQRVSPEVRA